MATLKGSLIICGSGKILYFINYHYTPCDRANLIIRVFLLLRLYRGQTTSRLFKSTGKWMSI